MRLLALLILFACSLSAQVTQIRGARNMPEITPPSNPAADSILFYVKDDGGTTKFCAKDSAGTENCLGDSAGGAPTGASYLVISLDGTLSAERTLAAGDGLALSDGGAEGAATLSTASAESNFLSDGGVTSLTCGASNGGRAQVLDAGTLQFCGGEATPALHTAAFGDASGNALAGDSATSFFSTGTLEDARLSVNVVNRTQSNIYAGGDQDFINANSLRIPTVPGIAPTANGIIAYDNSSNQFEYGDDGVNRIIVNTNESQTLTNKTLTTPTISGTGWTNANHTHAGATTGGLIAAAYRTRKASISLPDPATADSGKVQFEIPSAATMVEVACNVDAATSVTINLFERARATPETGTTGMLTSDLVCTTGGAASTTWTDAAAAGDVPIALGITAVSGSPTWVRVHVKYTLN